MHLWPMALLILLPPPPAAAHTSPPPLTQVAVILTLFDKLDAGCSGRYTDEQRTQLQRWQADNDLPALRARTASLRTDSAFANRLDHSAQQIVQASRSQGASDCAAAAALTKLPEAQWRPLSRPQPVPPEDATSAARREQASDLTTPAPVHVRGPVQGATLAPIDSFAFATRPKIGLGGLVVLDIYPMVLFKNGDLLTDVKGLHFPNGLDAHRAAHPNTWTRWRRDSGQLQQWKGGQWAPLPFKQTYAQLPANLRLTGRFRSLSGTGNAAAGGAQSVTVVDEYRFAADGRVVRSGTVGSTAQAGTTVMASRSGPTERPGRYRVDGLLLRIDYDDGTQEKRVLITDPDQPNGALWLDGEGYVERR